MTLTAKQKAWIEHKAAVRAEPRRRGIRIVPTSPVRRRRGPGGCAGCGHTMKHHKQSGRCRRGCECRAAVPE